MVKKTVQVGQQISEEISVFSLKDRKGKIREILNTEFPEDGKTPRLTLITNQLAALGEAIKLQKEKSGLRTSFYKEENLTALTKVRTELTYSKKSEYEQAKNRAVIALNSYISTGDINATDFLLLTREDKIELYQNALASVKGRELISVMDQSKKQIETEGEIGNLRIFKDCYLPDQPEEDLDAVLGIFEAQREIYFYINKGGEIDAPNFERLDKETQESLIDNVEVKTASYTTPEGAKNLDTFRNRFSCIRKSKLVESTGARRKQIYLGGVDKSGFTR